MSTFNPNIYLKATDLVGGLRVMMATAREPRTNWTIFEVLHQWCLTSLNEDIEDEPTHYLRTEARLIAHLSMEGHKQNMSLPPRAFIPMYKEVMADEWWEVTEAHARTMIDKIAELLNI